MKLRELHCKVLGHEVYDEETLRIQPWNWGEFRGFGAEAFAHKNCLRCEAPVGETDVATASRRAA